MKIKTLLVGLVILAATFYAGTMVTRQTESEKPPPTVQVAKIAPQSIAGKAPGGSTPSPQATNIESYGLLPNSAAARLSRSQLSALLHDNSVAAGYARDITDDLNFHDLAYRIAVNWADHDPQAALAWAKGLPAGTTQRDTIDAVFTVYAMHDSKAAMALAQSLPDDGGNGDRANALAYVAIGTAAQDPTQAAQLLTSLNRIETNISSDNPTGSVAASWLLYDPQAASQWIDTLPVGNSKDSAIMALLDVVGESDPASAFPWLRTMSNASARGTTTTKFVAQWAKTDPDAAAAAVMNAYPNNNNGRQATLLGIIQQTANSQAKANAQ